MWGGVGQRQVKLSYAGIDPGRSDERIDSRMPAVHQTPVHKPGPEDFHRGDKVTFTDKYLQHQVGIITCINQRTATVDCEGYAGWRVPFAMLRHVVDIGSLLSPVPIMGFVELLQNSDSPK